METLTNTPSISAMASNSTLPSIQVTGVGFTPGKEEMLQIRVIATDTITPPLQDRGVADEQGRLDHEYPVGNQYCGQALEVRATEVDTGLVSNWADLLGPCWIA